MSKSYTVEELLKNCPFKQGDYIVLYTPNSLVDYKNSMSSGACFEIVQFESIENNNLHVTNMFGTDIHIDDEHIYMLVYPSFSAFAKSQEGSKLMLDFEKAKEV